jgi:hypothetical protein
LPVAGVGDRAGSSATIHAKLFGILPLDIAGPPGRASREIAQSVLGVEREEIMRLIQKQSIRAGLPGLNGRRWELSCGRSSPAIAPGHVLSGPVGERASRDHPAVQLWSDLTTRLAYLS